MDGACSAHGDDEERVQMLVGLPEGRKLGRHRRRWEIIFHGSYVNRVGGCGMNSSVHDDRWWALVNTVMNLRVS
jgi:hypothetical protein